MIGSQLKKLYPEGWVLYCPDCSEYVQQSDPQNDSRHKSVVIDDEPCERCKVQNTQEVQEAQALMGRLGIPKENQ